jgi:hypothetical protein
MTSPKKAKAGSKAGKSKARSLKSLSVKNASAVRGGRKAQGGPIMAGWDVRGNVKA